MNTTTSRILMLATTTAAAAVLVACGGGGGGYSSSPAPTSNTGTVAVSLTDAPSCGFDQVNVTVQKVRINQSSTATENDSGWTDITLSPARKINLLNLTNGVLDALGQATLQAGHYSQLRLVLDPNTGGGTANSVVVTGQTKETSLDTPSAIQSGIKLVNEFDVTAGQRVDLVLDFDACKSIVTKGNGSYTLKPVVKVVPTAVSGIAGFVNTSLLASHVTVSAEQNGVIIASTAPDSTGSFFLSHLNAGNYDVVMTADAHATTVVGTVPVTSGNTTNLSTTAAPITMATSAVGSISGNITLAPANASVTGYANAKQTLTTGQTILVKFAGADAVSGAYTLNNLPLAAPSYAAYNTVLPLSFAPDSSSTPGAGKYKVDASATGYTTSTPTTVDINSINATNVVFTLVP